jgi:hypothetical protein
MHKQCRGWLYAVKEIPHPPDNSSTGANAAGTMEPGRKAHSRTASALYAPLLLVEALNWWRPPGSWSLWPMPKSGPGRFIDVRELPEFPVDAGIYRTATEGAIYIHSDTRT